MIYVFDTSSLNALNAYYPDIFKEFWNRFNRMVSAGHMMSTREVFREIGPLGREHTLAWAKNNKAVFTMPTAGETEFVAQIFAVPHFRQLIGAKQQLRGTPVADPFVIACAKANSGTVVTEEKGPANAARIPNVCAHFNVPCINLAGFMRAQRWSF